MANLGQLPFLTAPPSDTQGMSPESPSPSAALRVLVLRRTYVKCL